MSTHPTTATTPTARRIGTNRRAAFVGLAFVATGLLASCSGVGTSDAGQAASSADKKISTTEAPVASPIDDSAAPVGTPAVVVTAGSDGQSAPQGSANQGGGSSGGGSGQGNGAPAPAAPSHPSAPAPVINSFHTPDDIDCHNGDFQTFSASWSAANAEKVTISIDGPGIYKTYPATGSDSLPFNCSSAHTFLLTAYGHNGQKATRSITLQPRNVQTNPAPTDDDQQDPADAPQDSTPQQP